MARVTHIFFPDSWTQFLLVPLPLAQATLHIRLLAANYFPLLLSTPAIDTEGIRTPAGRAQWISSPLAARTQCLLPALCSPL